MTMTYTSTILIVDDEMIGREALESLLLGQGYQLLFACYGQEALSLASQYTPDLILLDVMMPGMDGFEVCRKIRADPALCEIPIMIVTSLDDRSSRLEGINAGADDFIGKPFDRVELRARVRTITRLNRYRRLKDIQKRFEWVINQSKDGFVIVNDDDKIIYANRQACLYLNIPLYDNDEHSVVLSWTFHSLVRRQYHCEPESAWATWFEHTSSQEQLHTQNIPRYLVCPETPTAHALWLKVDRLSLPTGLQQGHLIHIQDVTAQMTRQRQMWTFHSLITHKLATPLTALVSSIHLIEYSLDDMSTATIKEYLEIASISLQQLHAQIQEIRDYLKAPIIAREGTEYHMASFHQSIMQITDDLELKDVIITTEDSLENIWLVLSRQAMEMILRHLLENAKKFHPTQTPVVEISVSRSSEQTMSIQVRDNGGMLSPEQLALVGTPYYQAEKDFTGGTPGMGLGLAMVASLLWSVGGKYRIANRQPETGVVVECVVPIAKVPY